MSGKSGNDDDILRGFGDDPDLWEGVGGDKAATIPSPFGGTPRAEAPLLQDPEVREMLGADGGKIAGMPITLGGPVQKEQVPDGTVETHRPGLLRKLLNDTENEELATTVFAPKFLQVIYYNGHENVIQSDAYPQVGEEEAARLLEISGLFADNHELFENLGMKRSDYLTFVTNVESVEKMQELIDMAERAASLPEAIKEVEAAYEELGPERSLDDKTSKRGDELDERIDALILAFENCEAFQDAGLSWAEATHVENNANTPEQVEALLVKAKEVQAAKAAHDEIGSAVLPLLGLDMQPESVEKSKPRIAQTPDLP